MSANQNMSNVRLDYLWYEPVSNERPELLRFALEELEGVVIRLEHVTNRLHAVTDVAAASETKPDPKRSLQDAGLAISSLVSELAYHGESFLASTYELQDRLANLLAVLSECDKRTLVGFRGAFNKARMPRYRALEKTMPTVAREFIALERYLCEFVRLRNQKTHQASLHVALLVDGQPHDPEDVLLQIKGDREWFVRCVDQEARRFAGRHKEALDSISARIESLAESLRAARNLDE